MGGKNVTNRPYLLFQSSFGTYRILEYVFAFITDITWNILLCLPTFQEKNKFYSAKPVFLIIYVLDTLEGNVYIYISGNYIISMYCNISFLSLKSSNKNFIILEQYITFWTWNIFTYFFLIWNVASYAVTSLPCWQVCQGRIRLAQIMKSNRSSTYPEPWQDHYLRNTVPTQPRGFSLWCSTPQL